MSSRLADARHFAGACLVIGAMALGVSACGGSDNSSSSTDSGGGTATGQSTGTSTSGDTGGKSATQAALVNPASDAEFTKYIGGVIEPGFDTSKLKPYELDAFKLAAQPISDKERELLSTCLKQSPCDTGHGNLTIAYADSFGGNPVRHVYRAIITLQLLRYPQVRKIIYTDGAGDLRKTQANMRSLVAQKVDGIFGIFDFGAAMLPIARQAAAAGIPVVSESQNIPGATGKGDIAGDYDIDSCEQGTLSGEIAAKLKPGATVAMYTGTPGNPFAAKWQPCAEKAMKDGGADLTTNGTTNWSPQGESQAASALVAKGVPDAIIYDYRQTQFAQKILASGQKMPAQIGGSNDFGWYKIWLENQGTDKAFDGYITQSQGGYYNVPISMLVEKALGQGDEWPLHGVLPTTVTPAEKLKPYYDPSLPADTPFNSGLPSDILAEAIGAGS
jgi:hypothetical protein